MKLFNRKQVFTLAFNTEDPNNRLSQAEQFNLINHLSRIYGGATLVENVGGYMMDNGSAAIEYSYTITIVGAKHSRVLATMLELGKQNKQESILDKNKLVFC